MSTFFFVHANGFPSRSYAPFFQALEHHSHQVDYIDKIGHNPHYPISNNWPHLVQELAHEIRSRHTAPVIGMGHSAGGLLHYLLAAQQPGLFSHLILLDPPVINGWQNSLWWLSKRLNLSDYFTPARSSKKRRTHFASHAEAYGQLRQKSLFKNFQEDAFQAYLQHGLKPASGQPDSPVTLSFALEKELALFRTAPDHLWRYRKRLPMPGLYLLGEHSEFARYPFAQRLAKQSGMHYQLLPGGHLFPQEHPGNTARVIVEWLHRLSAFREMM